MLTATDILDMELSTAHQRILRELLRVGARGLSRRQVLEALYVKWPDMERRVSRGSRNSYVKTLLRELSHVLGEHGCEIRATEWERRLPMRWVLLVGGQRVATERPRRTPPGALASALSEMTAMPALITQIIAETGEAGISGAELAAQVYPEDDIAPPRDPSNSISVVLGSARRVLAKHGLRIVTRPRTGFRARRYLEPVT